MKTTYIITVAGLLGLVAPLSLAQPESNSVSELESKSTKTPGDKIVFRSGRSLEGVRILSMTQVEVKVEVLFGLPPLVLPTNQIASVRYGVQPPIVTEKEPGEVNVADTNAPPTLLPAMRIDLGFSKSLEEKIGNETREFRNQDIVEILVAVVEERGVSARFSPELLARPIESRRCSLTAHPDQTLDKFLRETVAEGVPWLKISYGFDTIQFELETE